MGFFNSVQCSPTTSSVSDGRIDGNFWDVRYAACDSIDYKTVLGLHGPPVRHRMHFADRRADFGRVRRAYAARCAAARNAYNNLWSTHHVLVFVWLIRSLDFVVAVIEPSTKYLIGVVIAMRKPNRYCPRSKKENSLEDRMIRGPRWVAQ